MKALKGCEPFQARRSSSQKGPEILGLSRKALAASLSRPCCLARAIPRRRSDRSGFTRAAARLIFSVHQLLRNQLAHFVGVAAGTSVTTIRDSPIHHSMLNSGKDPAACSFHAKPPGGSCRSPQDAEMTQRSSKTQKTLLPGEPGPTWKLREKTSSPVCRRNN